MCTRWLADMGADVIKIESSAGDPNRSRHPLRQNRSAMFGLANAGKKSVVLDLKGAAGRAAALGLAETAHVVIENWRPGVASRLGLGYEQIREINPAVVYCSISGFGQTGPQAQHAAYASVVEAASGLTMTQMRIDGAERPGRSGVFLGDLVTAIWGVVGIQSGLLHAGEPAKGSILTSACWKAWSVCFRLRCLEQRWVHSPGENTNRCLPRMVSSSFLRSVMRP